MKTETSITMADFKDLYEKYGPMVLRRCRFILKDEDAAMDAMQDVFVRIIEHRTKLSGVCASLFYTTATRVCLNKIRYEKLRKGPPFETIVEEIEDNFSLHHEEVLSASDLLDYIFQDLDKQNSDICVMHYLDGYTLEETAKAVGMSISGVRKRLDMIKRKAQKCVTD